MNQSSSNCESKYIVKDESCGIEMVRRYKKDDKMINNGHGSRKYDKKKPNRTENQ